MERLEALPYVDGVRACLHRWKHLDELGRRAKTTAEYRGVVEQLGRHWSKTAAHRPAQPADTSMSVGELGHWVTVQVFGMQLAKKLRTDLVLPDTDPDAEPTKTLFAALEAACVCIARHGSKCISLSFRMTQR